MAVSSFLVQLSEIRPLDGINPTCEWANYCGLCDAVRFLKNPIRYPIDNGWVYGYFIL